MLLRTALAPLPASLVNRAPLPSVLAAIGGFATTVSPRLCQLRLSFLVAVLMESPTVPPLLLPSLPVQALPQVLVLNRALAPALFKLALPLALSPLRLVLAPALLIPLAVFAALLAAPLRSKDLTALALMPHLITSTAALTEAL